MAVEKLDKEMREFEKLEIIDAGEAGKKSIGTAGLPVHLPPQ